MHRYGHLQFSSCSCMTINAHLASESEGSVRHDEQPKSVCASLRLFNHKPMPVILNRQKDTAVPVPKQNGDRARTRVLPHVAQGFLRHTIQLIFGGFGKFVRSSTQAKRTLNSAVA